MTFTDKYPIATNEILHYALMFPDTLKEYHVPGIAYATLDFLYEFASFFSIAPGTVRTNLSRMKKDGYVLAAGSDGDIRYRVSALQLETMHNLMKRKKARGKGYKIAVYSFEREQEKKRTKARSILEYAGFVRFAQNIFINVEIDDRELRKTLAQSGVGENVSIFDVPKIGEAETAAFVRAWDIPARAAFIASFLSDARAYLAEAADSDGTFFARLGYAWVAYITHVYLTEPPLPDELLPKDYAYEAVYAYLTKESARHGKRMMRYYREKTRK